MCWSQFFIYEIVDKRNSVIMVTNGKSGDNRRHGAVKNRSQVRNPKTNLYVKRNGNNGQFIDVKTSGGKFKGVRKEK